MDQEQFAELLLQSLEHEIGAVLVYEAALPCATYEDLRDEWQRYLDDTRYHVDLLRDLCTALEIDSAQQRPGRDIIRGLTASSVDAVRKALATGTSRAAQLVACECVVLMETRDHANWQLIGKCAGSLTGAKAEAVNTAYAVIEDQEAVQLFHSKGWLRELWLEALGLPAVLPPPEERKGVKTAVAAARAEKEGLQAR